MPTAPINNQGIFYEDSGGDKPAVMFMHGFLFDQSMFDKQVAALSNSCRCVRFDARGFGQTEWDGKPFSLYDTVADCVGLMDHLGIQNAVVVGMSQGGYAAMRVAVKHPERVKALVFLSTYNGVDTEEVKAIYRSMRDAWTSDGKDQVIGTLLTLFLGTEEGQPELRKQWRAKWEARSNEDIIATMNNLIDRDEITPEQVQKVTQPVLVVHGDADQGIPIVLGRALYQSMPNAKRFVSVPGATHAANITHADVVNKALLDFLAQYA
jgi:3-oxoadipate enol-lactonase